MIGIKTLDTGGKSFVCARCEKHAGLPPFNTAEESGAECGACCLDQAADALESRFAEKEALYKGIIDRAIERMNFMSPGAGDQFRDVILNDLRQIKAEQEQGQQQLDATEADATATKN